METWRIESDGTDVDILWKGESLCRLSGVTHWKFARFASRECKAMLGTMQIMPVCTGKMIKEIDIAV